MKRSISKFPVGAKWEVVTNDGKRGIIWLDEKLEYLEVWRWTTLYSDGSQDRSDWNTSYRLCRLEIPIWNHGKPLRFKRIR